MDSALLIKISSNLKTYRIAKFKFIAGKKVDFFRTIGSAGLSGCQPV